jgi:alpha-L-rhamnosidase
MDDYARTIINTAWCARVSDLMSRMAKILGKAEDVGKFHEYFENFRKAWLDKWVIDCGDTRYHSQSPIVLGLAFNLYPDEMRASAAKTLAEKIEKEGLMTGFAGISYVLPVLCEMGYSDLAYKVLENREYPSWLYCVDKGATTMWESFRGYHINEDGTFDIWGSLNHYSYGSVVRWLYAYAAGIQYDEAQPGFKHFYLRPYLSETMSHLDCSYDSPYGKISSGWSLTDGKAVYKATVPCNTTATLVLQGSGWSAPDGASLLSEGNGTTTFLLEAGEYEFTKGE